MIKSNRLNLPIQFVYFIGIIFVVFAAGFNQIIKGNELNTTSLQFIVDKDVVEAPRGKILDVDGRILAEDVKAFDIYLNYSNSMEDEYNQIKKFFEENNFKDTGMVLEKIDLTLEQNQRLFSLLNTDQVDKLEELINNLSTLEVRARYVRDYKYPYQFTHILGYTGQVEAEDVLERGYNNDDFIGKYRIENLYEEILKGSSGQLIKDGLSEISIPPIEGDNIYLTIDANWQNNLYRLLEDYNYRNGAGGGAGVIMDVETGDIKAMVSYPGFDTNLIVKGISEENFSTLQTARSQPLLDKAAAGAFTPGSIFKLITAYSLLKNEIITSGSTFFSNQCLSLGGGYDFCEFGKNFYGTLNLENALVKSSNVYFCNYMLKLSEEKGLSYFVTDAQKFGIGEKTGINIESEASGTMDSPSRKLETTSDGWFDGDTCNAAIGQGAITVTPIQMTVAVAMISNGGKKLEPNLISYTRDSSTTSVEYYNNTNILSDIQIPESIQADIKTGMYGVAHSLGSAIIRFMSGLDEYNIHAKTGSAEVLENVNGQFVERVHSWIVGTFEKDGRTYSFTFFQQYGGGGYYLSPILKDLLVSM